MSVAISQGDFAASAGESDMHERIPKISITLSLLLASACGGFGQAGSTSGGPSAAIGGGPEDRNPFSGAKYYLNPGQTERVEESAKRHPGEADLIRKVATYPTAIWLDRIAAVASVPGHLDAAKRQQDANGQPTVTVFNVYDLPNRDCSASSSAGELRVENDGEAIYKTKFIDPIAAAFVAHPDQPIVVVLEPDSLGNMATNMALPNCQAARSAYKNGVVYAIRKFHLPNVWVYLDAAHAGWLGWDGNRQAIARIFKHVLADAGGNEMIRGFATNTSNYTHLTNKDGAGLEPTNPCPNELTYIKMLSTTLNMNGIKGKHFIVDTARNGRGGIRRKWGNWCNIKGAGLGERPRADPEPNIDAYFWLKPPGESDGSSDPSQPRFDDMCASPDATPNAPQAGEWFDSYFMDLVHYANPPL
jgi:cellulose 1,4-beta-cellobiosidase